MSADRATTSGGGDPRAMLRAAGLRPKRRLGQNFLVAAPIAHAIAELCVPEPEVGRARVLEIGAGTGALTAPLAERARQLIAIERDADLVPLLERTFAAADNVRIVAADAQTAVWPELLGPASPDSPRVVCGNLPYAITGALLRLAVQHAADFERAVFMVQHEVAERLTAAPGDKEWGALTVFARAAFAVRRAIRVSAGSFHPAPEVQSAVVVLAPLRPARAQETPTFVALVHRAFEGRRKMLRNAWAGLAPDGAALAAAAMRAGVSLEARGETLDVEAFAKMAAQLDAITARR